MGNSRQTFNNKDNVLLDRFISLSALMDYMYITMTNKDKLKFIFHNHHACTLLLAVFLAL